MAFGFFTLCISLFGATASHADDFKCLLDRSFKASKVDGPHCSNSATNEESSVVDPCAKLSDLTCSKGDIHDGTGNSWSGSESELEKKEDERLRTLARPFFEAKMKRDPDFKLKLTKFLRPNEAELRKLKSQSDAQWLDLAVFQGYAALRRGMPGLVPDWSKGVVSFFSPKLGDKWFGRKEREEEVFGDFFAYVKASVKDSKLEAKVADEYLTIQKTLIHVIKDKIPAGPGRDRMVDTILKVKFAGIDCEEMTTLAWKKTRLDSLLIPNAFFSPSSGQFKYCNGLGRYNESAFQRLMVIAHELTHSIDPCSFERDKLPFPAPKIVSCLRTAGAALQRPTPKPEAGAIPSKEPKPLTSCDSGDQIGESFSDFLASEASARLAPALKSTEGKGLSRDQYRKGFANAMRFPTGCKARSGFDVHPETATRIDKVIFAHPQVQSMMGCDPVKKPLYCGDQHK